MSDPFFPCPASTLYIHYLFKLLKKENIAGGGKMAEMGDTQELSLHGSSHPPTDTKNCLYFISNVRTRNRTHVQTLPCVETHRSYEQHFKKHESLLPKLKQFLNQKDVVKLQQSFLPANSITATERHTHCTYDTGNRTYFHAISSTLFFFTTRTLNLKPSNCHFFSFTEGISGSLWHFQGSFTQR